MVKKVISGGQTGADIGGLIAATSLGIETGGTMPKKFLTEDGYKPEYEEAFGMVQSRSSKYSTRTEQNVKDADATIIFNFAHSAGSYLTAKVATKNQQPLLHIIERGQASDDVEIVNKIVDWLYTYQPRVLNVAGNRESRYPGITRIVSSLLMKALLRFKVEADFNAWLKLVEIRNSEGDLVTRQSLGIENKYIPQVTNYLSKLVNTQWNKILNSVESKYDQVLIFKFEGRKSKVGVNPNMFFNE